ncbi:DUF4301 family protein [Saccharicrinis aurantiacus]|uniref:DUF4301 family protein n=1 Tax=Saccharicrinis aurantiacus TaxID=1849719 RepID=UPI002493BDEB|nr:DUF4301 family protein [Saccharicrinis aurantiacus]
MISEKDKEQISSKGTSLEKVITQIDHFKNGFPFMNIEKPASIGNGIIKLDEESKLTYTDYYRTALENDYTVSKFVPASGAATRMFKDLFSYINADEEAQKLMEQEGPIQVLLAHINCFAFSKDLEKITGVDLSDEKSVFENGVLIVSKLLLEDGLKYGIYPKGVLKFHLSDVRETTPIEEHLIEGALYGCSNHNEVQIHFTVSPNHQALFQEIVNEKLPLYEAKFDVQYKITYSTQKSSTDTIAVNKDNTPFRNPNGQIVFRPGGHGALIENLNDIYADIIFIKNIDNVSPEYRLKDTIQYKEALAGVLCFYQGKVFDILKDLESNSADNKDLDSYLEVLKTELQIIVPDDVLNASNEEKVNFINEKLNRPIRVCGMVKNEGEPGGGPFWGVGKHGETSLQVVESSQIDLNDPIKKELVSKSTHFNPVDLICGVNNHKGEKYDLLEFVDPKTGFISAKSLNGKDLKALELPGLWNGAMSDWITLFVEVPISTFNPVKTINDLLRPEHQPEYSEQH